MLGAAIVLFVVAIGLSFFRLRIAAVISLLASALSLPLYLFNALPISLLDGILPYRSSLSGSPPGFRLTSWAVAGVLSVAVTTFVSVRLLLRSGVLRTS
jgi:hypothetical protein